MNWFDWLMDRTPKQVALAGVVLVVLGVSLIFGSTGFGSGGAFVALGGFLFAIGVTEAWRER